MKLSDSQMEKAFRFWLASPNKKKSGIWAPHALIAVSREQNDARDMLSIMNEPMNLRTTFDTVEAWEVVKWGAERSAVYLAEVDRLQAEKDKLLKYQRKLVRNLENAVLGRTGLYWCKAVAKLLKEGPRV